MGPLPEEDATIKRQVNRLHKSRPSDLSYMKRRHHLEWHRFRNHGTPDRRRDRLYSLEDIGVRVVRAIRPAGTTFVDPLNGSFMGDPSLVGLASTDCTTTKVLVELSRNASHYLLETGQLVFQVLQSIVENIDLGVLLPNHLTKVATLKKS